MGVEDPTYWDAVMIKLPLGYYSVKELGPAQQKQLENDLNTWRLQKKLLLGGNNAKYRPGSYIVFAREVPKDENGASYWRNFFCMDWKTPTQWFHIVFQSSTEPSGSTGSSDSSCFIQSGPGFAHLSNSDVMV